MISKEEKILRLNDVSKYYGEVTAVDQVSFGVNESEFLTLLGPSGSGKTTILMMIAGFSSQSSGDIFVRGKPVASKKPYERDVGMVFQSLALFPHMNVRENIAFPLKMRGFDKSEMEDRIRAVLEVVQMPELADRGTEELSGGQRQRVALARALVFNPSVLLLDEALGALDRELRKTLQLEIMRIQDELEITTISVTHDQKEALVMSDRIGVINDGKLEQLGPNREVYFLPQTKFVAQFIGHTNLFDGKCVEASADYLIAELDKGTRIKLPSSNGVTPGEDLCAGVKAEQISLYADEPAELENKIKGRVTNQIFEGDRSIYEIKVENLEDQITVFEQNDLNHNPFEPGKEIYLGWNPESTTLITDG